MNLNIELPADFYYPIKDNDQLHLKVSIGFEENKNFFWVESTIVFKQTNKIFKSLGKKYNLIEFNTAKSFGLKMYNDFINLAK